MAKTIRISLSDVASVDAAIRELEAYRDTLPQKAEQIAEQLANAGYNVAFGIMAGHIYSGETISSLSVQQTGPTRFELVAGSVALLFFEFGAGIPGVGHPLADDLGMGAGTYPGQTHAFDPNGWWFPTDDPNLAVYTAKDGRMYGHSRGQAPHMPMYQAAMEMRRSLEKIAREVFAS